MNKKRNQPNHVINYICMLILLAAMVLQPFYGLRSFAADRPDETIENTTGNMTDNTMDTAGVDLSSDGGELTAKSDTGIEDITPEVMNGEVAVSDELLIMVEKGTKNSEIRAMASDAGTSVSKVNTLADGTRMAKIKTGSEDPREAAASLQEEGQVITVQPNYIYRLADASKQHNINDGTISPQPASSITDLQWHLGSGEQGSLNAIAAWELLEGNSGSSFSGTPVKVAVIDTGVKRDHIDLNEVVIPDECVTYNDGRQAEFTAFDGSDDDNGHGTHVCGIIAAEGQLHTGSQGSCTGASGVAKNRVNIICIDAEDPDTKGFSTEDVCLSINYAVNQGARVINMSIGALYRDLVMESYIKDAWDKGVLCVCAAGNENSKEFCSPGDSPHAISVMNHEKNGTRHTSSNYGVEKDVSAPGTDILSTDITPSNGNGDYYVSKSGTSMASPMVAGIAALLLSEQSTLNPRELKNYIYTSAATAGSGSFDGSSSGRGFGRVNAYNAAFNLKADPVSPDDLVLNKSSISLSEGRSTSVEYALFPGSASSHADEVTFISDNPDIATVDDQGIIKGAKAGETTIKVSCGTIQKTVSVTVKGMSYSRIYSLPRSLSGDITSDDYAVKVNNSIFDQWVAHMKGYELSIPAGKSIDITLNTISSYPFIIITDQDGNIWKNIGSSSNKVLSFTFAPDKTSDYRIALLHIPFLSDNGKTTYQLDIAYTPEATTGETGSTGSAAADNSQSGSGSDNNTQPTPGDGNNTQPTPGDGNNTQPSPGDGNNTQPTPGDGNNTQPTPGNDNNTQPSPGNDNNTQYGSDDNSRTPSASSEAAERKLVQRISIAGISGRIAAGKKIKLKASVYPEKAYNKKVIWSSSNPKLATVTRDGLVKVKKKAEGKTVRITAKAADGSGKKAIWTIKVMKGRVKKLSLKKKTISLKAGKTRKLKVKVDASKGANKKLKWTTDHPEWASVKKGKVKALPAGKGKKVKVTVKTTDGTNLKKTITINIQ